MYMCQMQKFLNQARRHSQVEKKYMYSPTLDFLKQILEMDPLPVGLFLTVYFKSFQGLLMHSQG